MIQIIIKAVVAFFLTSVGSSAFAEPPTIACGSVRVAQNDGGCDNASARAYDWNGQATPFQMGQVRTTTNQGSYNGSYNTNNRHYNSGQVRWVIEPAVETVIVGSWNQTPNQVVVVQQPVTILPPCQRVSKNLGEWAVGTVVSGLKGIVGGEGAGLAYHGLTGRDGNYEKRGRQFGGGAGLVAGAFDTDKVDCSERDAFIRDQEEVRLARIRPAQVEARPVPSVQPARQNTVATQGVCVLPSGKEVPLNHDQCLVAEGNFKAFRQEASNGKGDGMVTCFANGNDFGLMPKASCVSISAHLTKSAQAIQAVPAEVAPATKEEPAVCMVTREMKDGTLEEKKFLNPSRAEGYCKVELLNGLKDGTIAW